jgi:hypothetical protein
MGYEGASASDQNVSFAYDLALAAARDLWALAAQLRSHQSVRASAAQTARDGWEGPKHDQFEEKMRQEGTDTAEVAGSLERTARTIATSWAAARGQQDRINKARYVDAELDDDNWLENSWEWFAGENDFGPPPDNPADPHPPDFSPTRAPMYSEYELRV